MATRVKRTYNLSTETIRRVRELASEYGVADSQDRVVELAVERFYGQQRATEEAALWAEAADDDAFQREVAFIREAYDDRDVWPR
jgi:hypothetical protein